MAFSGLVLLPYPQDQGRCSNVSCQTNPALPSGEHTAPFLCKEKTPYFRSLAVRHHFLAGCDKVPRCGSAAGLIPGFTLWTRVELGDNFIPYWSYF